MIFAVGLLLVLGAPFMAAVDPTVYWFYVGFGFFVMALGFLIELLGFLDHLRSRH